MPRDEFDNTVAIPVETMSKVAFSHWIAEVHAEVSNHINSGIGKPARTMIRLSTSSFIGTGTLLRKLAMLEDGLLSKKEMKRLELSQAKGSKKLYGYGVIESSESDSD